MQGRHGAHSALTALALEPWLLTSSGAASWVEPRKAAAIAARPPGSQSTPSPCRPRAPQLSQRQPPLPLLRLKACTNSATASAMAPFRRRWLSSSAVPPLQGSGEGCTALGAAEAKPREGSRHLPLARPHSWLQLQSQAQPSPPAASVVLTAGT